MQRDHEHVEPDVTRARPLAPAKHVRIAALEPHHGGPSLGKLQQQLVDLLLRVRVCLRGVMWRGRRRRGNTSCT